MQCRYRSGVAVALILLALAAPASAARLPEPLSPFVATYRLTNGFIQVGTTTISLQPHPSGWRYASVTEATGVFSLFISGKAVDATVLERHGDGLRPLRYHHSEPDGDDEIIVDFDWADATATVLQPSGTRTLALEPGMMDGFSATLALLNAIAAGRERFSIRVIGDEGEFETLRFRVRGRETIEVPLGRFETVRVARIRRDSDRETITWLAPALDWVAVRVEQYDDGELVGRLELTAIRGKAAAGRSGEKPGEADTRTERSTPRHPRL